MPTILTESNRIRELKFISVKKLFTISLFAVFLSKGFSQTKYWVQFTDKKGTPFSVSSPAAYLSTQSILRRTNQGIAIDSTDLPVNSTYINGVLGTGVVTLINRSKWFNAITIQTTDPAALAAIPALPYVKNLQPVERIKGTYEVEENSFSQTTNTDFRTKISQLLPYPYGPSYNQAAMIGVGCLHNMGFNGKGKVIAVLDAGFQDVNILSAFDSLWANGQILGTWDFVNNEPGVFEDHWHGMMVLSTMGGYLPDSIVGTAPKANYWLLRTEEAATEYIIEEDNWVAGAEFADSVGADVLNTSLGYTTFDSTSQNHTYSDMDGNTTRISIGNDIAAAKGMFVVCSAGNSGGGAWFYIGAPADADSVLAVGAVNAAGIVSSFSSRGPSYDGRVKPNVAAQGEGATVASLAGGILNASGTSFSSPITAGAVACLWQANPAMTNMQLFNAIQQSADLFSSPDSLKGYGIPNFCAANTTLSGLAPVHYDVTNLLSIFPNPFIGSFEINFYSSLKQKIIIRLSDVIGKKIYEHGFSCEKNTSYKFRVDELEHLSKGIYFLNIRTPDNLFTKKIVKE